MKLSMVCNGEEEFIILKGVTKDDVKDGVLKLFNKWYENKGFLTSSIRFKFGDGYIDVKWSKDALQDMQGLFGIDMIKEMAGDVTKAILPEIQAYEEIFKCNLENYTKELYALQEKYHHPYADVVN